MEFRVNGIKQNHAMKLGEGGEAFFVFETSDEIPESMQTSPVLSPAASPQSLPEHDAVSPTELQEPEYLDLDTGSIREGEKAALRFPRPAISTTSRAKSDFGTLSKSHDSTLHIDDLMDRRYDSYAYNFRVGFW